MNAKSVLAAVLLIGLGIIFGVVLITNFNSTDRSYALTNPEAIIGARPTSQDITPTVDPHALSNAFIHAAERIVPTVVSITVTSTQDSRRPRFFDDFHRFFGPDFEFRQDQTPIPRQGSGSGVIATTDGYIITNNHVVANADANGIKVVLNDRREYTARLVGSDQNTDLAVIKIEGDNLTVAEFGNSDELRVGEWVLAVGNPLQLTSTVTHGIVSALGRGALGVISGEYSIENFIQTDAAINPGNSGGPLINLRGEVIGINVAIATTSARFQGYGFAIPVNLARVVVEDIIRHGFVRRAYLGVRIQAVDETSARALGLDKVRGVLVQDVVSGGPAEAAGLKAGDVILKVDDKEVNQSNELQMEIARRQPDSKVKITVYRDGRERTLDVTLKTLGDDSAPIAEAQPTRDDTDRARPEPETVTLENIGLTLRQLDSETKQQREVEAGVLIQGVSPLSPAQQRGIVRGDIIVEADRKKVNTMSDFRTIIDSKKPGDALMLRVQGTDKNYRFVALSIPKDPS
jgi:serine protease Do